MAGKIITKKWKKKHEEHETNNHPPMEASSVAGLLFSFSFNRKSSGDIHGPVVKRHGGEIGTHGNNSRPVCRFFSFYF